MNKYKLMDRFSEITNIGLSVTEIEGVLLFMEIEELIKETENAYKQLKVCVSDYWKKEQDASKEIKILMLVNNWHSPFEVCNELVKRIETNETFLKNICKTQGTTFKKIGYSSKTKLARELLNKAVAKNTLEVKE